MALKADIRTAHYFQSATMRSRHQKRSTVELPISCSHELYDDRSQFLALVFLEEVPAAIDRRMGLADSTRNVGAKHAICTSSHGIRIRERAQKWPLEAT